MDRLLKLERDLMEAYSRSHRSLENPKDSKLVILFEILKTKQKKIISEFELIKNIRLKKHTPRHEIHIKVPESTPLTLKEIYNIELALMYYYYELEQFLEDNTLYDIIMLKRIFIKFISIYLSH